MGISIPGGAILTARRQLTAGGLKLGDGFRLVDSLLRDIIKLLECLSCLLQAAPHGFDVRSRGKGFGADACLLDHRLPDAPPHLFGDVF
ncbi:MAG: hypothetical protein ABSH09_00375 [Bryobacteraceae bacterium]